MKIIVHTLFVKLFYGMFSKSIEEIQQEGAALERDGKDAKEALDRAYFEVYDKVCWRKNVELPFAPFVGMTITFRMMSPDFPCFTIVITDVDWDYQQKNLRVKARPEDKFLRTRPEEEEYWKKFIQALIDSNQWTVANDCGKGHGIIKHASE